MYNVALNIKAPSTRIWIFLKLNIFFITKRPSLNTTPVNPLSHAWPIHVKKYVVSKHIWIPVAGTGAINWYLKDLVTFPLICWLRSVLIYLQQKEISHLHSRNLLEITATYNLTRSAYQDKCGFNTYRVRLIGKSGLRILQWNAKSEFRFHLWEIRPQGESGFHGFPFNCSTEKYEKRFAKLLSWTAVFFLLIMHGRARPLFLRTVCQILFRNSQSNSTKEIHKQISQIQNPDFKI